MENASKALIIAGAILLSILLISLGIMVYTNAKGTVGETNLDSEEIQTFNTKISQYCGKNKSANDMNALMSVIISLKSDKSGRSVDVDVSNVSDYVTGSDKNYTFDSGRKYTAEYSTGTNGYINKVTIK